MKKWIIGPIIAMAILTPFTPLLDQSIARMIYERTHFSGDAFSNFFYNYGRLPAVILFFFALFILVGSYLSAALKKWRPAALALSLMMVIGPGLIVNALLKDHWGRPRPKQTEEFGGTQSFRPYYLPNFSEETNGLKSFPCGHCSMGFYFFSLALVGRQYGKRWVFFTGLFLAIFLGVALSIARMLQGGHYLSDVLMSGLLMWLTAVAIDKALFDREDSSPQAL
jgi:lipid A 4'-phosphatase